MTLNDPIQLNKNLWRAVDSCDPALTEHCLKLGAPPSLYKRKPSHNTTYTLFSQLIFRGIYKSQAPQNAYQMGKTLAQWKIPPWINLPMMSAKNYDDQYRAWIQAYLSQTPETVAAHLGAFSTQKEIQHAALPVFWGYACGWIEQMPESSRHHIRTRAIQHWKKTARHAFEPGYDKSLYFLTQACREWGASIESDLWDRIAHAAAHQYGWSRQWAPLLEASTSISENAAAYLCESALFSNDAEALALIELKSGKLPLRLPAQAYERHQKYLRFLKPENPAYHKILSQIERIPLISASILWGYQGQHVMACYHYLMTKPEHAQESKLCSPGLFAARLSGRHAAILRKKNPEFFTPSIYGPGATEWMVELSTHDLYTKLKSYAACGLIDQLFEKNSKNQTPLDRARYYHSGNPLLLSEIEKIQTKWDAMQIRKNIPSHTIKPRHLDTFPCKKNRL